MSKLIASLTLIYGFSITAQAQEFRKDFEWYNSDRKVERNKGTFIDPTGGRLGAPESLFQSDLRLNSKYTFESGSRLVFRPRLLLDYKTYPESHPGPDRVTQGKLSLPEGYLEWDADEKTTLAGGLQNYQWGPSELMSPSNPFFHFRPEQRSYNYKEDGRFLLRLNWSPGANWNLIGLVEPINNGNSFWIYEKKFQPKALIKLERHGENALNYFGFGAGTMDDRIPFIGEYFNYEIRQGLSIYLDGRQSQGRAQYTPRLAPDTLYDMVYVRDSQAWETLMVSGLRWEEGDFDVRMEFIYNSYGLTLDEMQAAVSSVLPAHPRGDQNLKRLNASGMELPGQKYGYVSLRIPNVFIDNNNLSFRYLRSLTDQSATLQTAYDGPLGKAWTLFAELNISLGKTTEELSALEKGSGTLGVKWNF